MKKSTKIISNIIQLILPILFLFYFKYYITFHGLMQTASVSTMQIAGFLLLYFLLLLLLLFTASYSRQEKGSLFITALAWLEAAALYILPLFFGWKTELFTAIKGYVIDYLYIYGIVVFLYSISLIHSCLISDKGNI